MVCCLNPACEQPLNPDQNRFCQNCGTNLVSVLRHRYQVLKPLNRGGFSRTYLAQDLDMLDEPCVVKKFFYCNLEAANRAEVLFKREAICLKELGQCHPQIPSLLAFFREEETLYLVMQFIAGVTLATELQQAGKFSEAKIWELLFDLLPLLQFIHTHGVIHRDLKPENIMRRPQDSKLVLVDFGGAKLLSLGQSGSIFGSPGYIAPEMLTYGQASFASDLFSLGVICFNLLSGIDPDDIQREYGPDWMKVWPEQRGIDLSSELAWVLDKLLEPFPTRRYRSAQEVLVDLSQKRPVLPSILSST